MQFPLIAAIAATMISVHDGDTIIVSIGGAAETVRLHTIDAPELPPRARCEAEAQAAAEATVALQSMLPQGLAIRLEPLKSRPRDRYGRMLALAVTPSGTDVAAELVRRHLARPWTGKRHGWCPDLSP